MKDERILSEGHELWIRIAKAIHFIVVIALFAVCRRVFFSRETGISALRQQAPSVILFEIAVFALIRVFNAYLVGLLETKEIIIAQQLAAFLSLSLVGLFDLLENGTSARLAVFLIVDFTATFAWNVIWCIAADRLYRKYVPRKSAVFICTDAINLRRLETAFSGARCFQIEKAVAVDSTSSIEALADALLLRPRVLLLDDFLAGLDSAMRASMGAILTNAAAFSGVIVTGHELDDLARWTTRFLVLRDGVISASVDTAGLDVPVLRERLAAALEGGLK